MPAPLKRVLLVDPPAKYPQTLNTGLGWLAANIAGVTSNTRVLGLANISCTIERAKELLRRNTSSFSPHIIGFNIHCNTYQTVLNMIEDLEKYFKGTIAVGGPHTFYERSSIIKKTPRIDVVVIGEAEFSFAEVCLREHGDYCGIEGIIFHKNGELVEEHAKSFKKEFGNLRYPDYRQFGIKKIYCPYPISTSRGCPFNCCFCNPFMGGKYWRPRHLENVFDELNFAMKEFSIRSFAVVEPVFNFRPQRIIDFCENILKRKINLPWYVASGLRADFITPEMIKMMKKAGCTHIKIGVETLVPEIFKHVDKGETLEDIKKAASIVKSYGMPLSGSFIIGLPYETVETVRLNYKLSKKLKFDYTEWSLLFPYPGTPAYKWMQENGNIYHSIETAHQSPFDLDGRQTVNIACDTPEFSKEERIMAFWEINTKTGNYVVSLNDSDLVSVKNVLKAVIKHDFFRIFWHLMHFFRIIKRRAIYGAGNDVKFIFNEDAFR